MRPFSLLLVVVLLGVAFAEEPRCPQVYDGLTNGHFDLSTQFSTSSMSANWVGLTSNDILSYEVAVVSEAQLKTDKLTGSCRLIPGFVGLPNVKHWTDVRKETSVTITGLRLVPETSYFVVLRTTLKSGVQLFSNSNGIVVIPEELNLEGSQKNERNFPASPNQKVEESSCPIDEANRCRAGQVSVQDFLNEFYGPPRFAEDTLLLFAIPFTPADDDDDDDDDGARNDGIIAGVIAGVLLLCLLCLLLLGLLALMFNKNGGDEPFQERIVERKQEHVDADLGSSTEHAIADTRVEFPDIDPHSRLSQAN